MPITKTLSVSESSGGSKPIPEGLYKAQVKDITEGSGEFGDYVKVAFEIVDGEYKGVEKTLVASFKLTKSKDKNSKLYDTVKSIIKEEPKIGASFDLNQIIGKTCQILIVNGKLVNGVQYQNISKVLPDKEVSFGGDAFPSVSPRAGQKF